LILTGRRWKNNVKAHYFEILEAFDEEPLWYDWHGVPRWCIPEEAHYPRHLMGRIRCQECRKEFWVALGDPVYYQDLSALIAGRHGNVVPVEDAEFDPVNKSHLKLIEYWSYGDSPRHGGQGMGNCVAGDTMSSDSEYEWDEPERERP